MGQVVKIKSRTVCGQNREGDKVGEIQWVVLGTVVKAEVKYRLFFHPLVSTCCSQKKHFILFPLAWGNSPTETRPALWPAWSPGVSLDSPQGRSSGCGAQIERQKTQDVRCLLLFANVVSFYISHMWIWSIQSWGCVFPTEWWMINGCCWLVWLL